MCIRDRGFATQGTIGEFFALVIKATSVEQKTTFDKGEPYLEVHGVDMDRVPITALRMWMFEEGEIVPGNLYILRGLRVAPDRVWDDAAWKYVPSPDRRKLDCSGRSAVEDVTSFSSIAAFF